MQPLKHCPCRFTGGWQLNGIITMYSGQALTPLLSYDYTNTGSAGDRPDQISNPYDFSSATSVGCPSNKQSLQCWYNPAAYAIPALAPGQTLAREYGGAGRNSLRGPAQYNVDFSVLKNFKLRETMNLEFRAEAFNLFNTPQFGVPYSVTDLVGSPAVPPSAQNPSGTPAVAPLAGLISGTVHAPRQIQFALLFKF